MNHKLARSHKARILLALTALTFTFSCHASANVREVFCEEETRLMGPWLNWAAAQHEICSTTTSAERRLACTRQVLAELTSLKTEYASIYMNRISTVSKDHPVMKQIINRLDRSVESAQQIVLTGDAPAALAAQHKMSCLNQP